MTEGARVVIVQAADEAMDPTLIGQRGCVEHRPDEEGMYVVRLDSDVTEAFWPEEMELEQ